MPDEFDDDKPSKSQRKREMDALKDIGVRLLELPQEQIDKLSEARLIEAIGTCKRIHKGSARKRQLQYIGKLLRDEALLAEAKALIDRMDASTKAHVQAFHKLEQWRERLISEDDQVMTEIIERYPNTDRQHLRQLTRKAIDERRREATPPVAYRKLFQYLKQLIEDDSR